MASKNRQAPSLLRSIVIGFIVSFAITVVLFFVGLFLGLFESGSLIDLLPLLFVVLFVLVASEAYSKRIDFGQIEPFIAITLGFLFWILNFAGLAFAFPVCSGNVDVALLEVLLVTDIAIVLLAYKYIFKTRWIYILFLAFVAAFAALLFFSIGVFCPARFTVACVSAPGFLCSNIILSSDGNLTATIGQATGSAIYNVGVGCAATVSNSGLPNPSMATVYLANNGSATPDAAGPPHSGALNLSSGETIKVKGLKCWNSDYMPMSSSNAPIGSAFSGALWINYTNAPGAPTGPSGTNPMLNLKFATVVAKVV